MAHIAAYSLAVMCLTVELVHCYTQGSCKQIKTSYPWAPSGIYHIQAGSYNLIEVYCEMGLNGGGYTFLSPRAMAEITDEDLQPLITDRKSVLMRIRRCDGTQPYSVLQQLPQYQHIPILYSLNNFTGYQPTFNLDTIGSPFLYTGFLPKSVARVKGTVQGITANGVPHSFTNCDGNGNSYMTMYPNFNEKTPNPSGITLDYPYCNNLFNAAIQPPSGRVMPPEYFLFTEFHFGGCGCYYQSDERLRKRCFLGFQIGFR